MTALVEDPRPEPSLRIIYGSWPLLNEALVGAVLNLSPDDLALRPSPDQWPLWALLGHLACQRVFWLCDFAGVPGAHETPFRDAARYCPGEDPSESPWNADELVTALISTFAIVERCLDEWKTASLTELVTRPEFGAGWEMTRAQLLERVRSHDSWHAGQASQLLSGHGLGRLSNW